MKNNKNTELDIIMEEIGKLTDEEKEQILKDNKVLNNFIKKVSERVIEILEKKK